MRISVGFELAFQRVSIDTDAETLTVERLNSVRAHFGFIFPAPSLPTSNYGSPAYLRHTAECSACDR